MNHQHGIPNFLFSFQKGLNLISNCVFTCAELLIVSSIAIGTAGVNHASIERFSQKLQHVNIKFAFYFNYFCSSFFSFNFIRSLKRHEKLKLAVGTKCRELAFHEMTSNQLLWGGSLVVAFFSQLVIL